MLKELPHSTAAELSAKSEHADQEIAQHTEAELIAARGDLTQCIAQLTEIKDTRRVIEKLAGVLSIMHGGGRLGILALDQNASVIASLRTEAAGTAGGEGHKAGEEQRPEEYETRVTVGSTTLAIAAACSLSAQAEHETRTLARVAALQIEMNARKPWVQAEDAAQSVNDEQTLNSHRNHHEQSTRDIERLARSPFNALLTGETGTGKTTIARQIHRRSARAGTRFVEFNCAALPEHLAEAELFGHKKGAFTGANADRAGLFEAAIGGTLFLDEVGELSPAIQSKLLKAIEERKIRRLGENHDRVCDVRVIAATSRNLPEMMHAGTFREDLYYRIATLRLEVLPLRERRDEIPAFVEHFLSEAAAAQGEVSGAPPSFRIEQRGIELLCGFGWGGNIRELRNTVLELTSYVRGDEPITAAAVRSRLAERERLAARPMPDAYAGSLTRVTTTTAPDHGDSHRAEECGMSVPAPSGSRTSAARMLLASAGVGVEDGDILIPFDVCVVRRGETINQWQTRAMVSCIGAAREECGEWNSVASRLGTALSSIKQRNRKALRRMASCRIS